MKVLTSVDAGSGYVHTITDTSANIHDILETSKRFREDNYVVYGDSRYFGALDCPEIKDNEILSKSDFRINKRPSSLKTTDKFRGLNWDKRMERDKPSVRCKVEYVFLIVKN